MILVKNTPFSIKGEAFLHLNPAACFLAAHLNHSHISKPKRCFISMTRTVIDQRSLNCFDYTLLPGMFEHAPSKCLLTYLWTIYMYYSSAHIFFLPTKNTVHPTSETTAIHEKTKGTQMLLSRKDSFSSCWKKASFVPHLSAFSFVCYWQFLQIPNAAKLVTQQFLPPSFILNCFSAYQSQVCWKPSQKNLLI